MVRRPWMSAVGHRSRTYIKQRMSWPSPTSVSHCQRPCLPHWDVWLLNVRRERVATPAFPRSFFRRRCIAQNIIGSAPGSLPLKAAIDRVVSSLREMKSAREASCLQEYTPSKRDLAKNHSWTWLRTIWLTGPFALTVALREYVQRGTPPRPR